MINKDPAVNPNLAISFIIFHDILSFKSYENTILVRYQFNFNFWVV